tara:strand:+ start:430 stop:939 length:510 start_codon:yes stop_codon:yes gene_type:complete
MKKMINTFTAIDFETATKHHICSVGIVTIENGKIVDEYHALIQPPNNEYNWHNTNVHGITEYDTRNEPLFNEIYPEIKKRIFGKILVAHNESFDRNVLTKTMGDNRLAYSELNLSEKWECTLKIYKARGYKPANLSACCKIHGITLEHHQALSDAKACARLFYIAQKNL